MAASAVDAIWRFARGDMPAAEFEAWVYRETDLERLLGASLYLQTVSTDFRSRSEVYEA